VPPPHLTMVKGKHRERRVGLSRAPAKDNFVIIIMLLFWLSMIAFCSFWLLCEECLG